MGESRNATALATKAVLRQFPGLEGEDLDQAVQDELGRWEDEAIHEREVYGQAPATHSIETCDTSGTGEGRYHGLIR